MARIIEAHTELDLTHRLAQITCPTFVCHSINDSEYPFAIGQRLAEAIPKARLVAIEGDVRGAFVEAQATINALELCLPAPITPTTERPRSSRDGETPATRLTPREIEILRLIAAGQTSKEISGNLALSIRTVGRHITNIYEKIDARSRADATAFAVRHGLTRD